MGTAAPRVGATPLLQCLTNVHTGVSLLTQVLYAIVFCSRYLDIFTTKPAKDFEHVWNFSLKVRA